MKKIEQKFITKSYAGAELHCFMNGFGGLSETLPSLLKEGWVIKWMDILKDANDEDREGRFLFERITRPDAPKQNDYNCYQSNELKRLKAEVKRLQDICKAEDAIQDAMMVNIECLISSIREFAGRPTKDGAKKLRTVAELVEAEYEQD